MLTPVSITLKFVFLNFSIISSVLSIVVISISSTSFVKNFLTQPPTNRADTVSFENLPYLINNGLIFIKWKISFDFFN